MGITLKTHILLHIPGVVDFGIFFTFFFMHELARISFPLSFFFNVGHLQRTGNTIFMSAFQDIRCTEAEQIGD